MVIGFAVFVQPAAANAAAANAADGTASISGTAFSAAGKPETGLHVYAIRWEAGTPVTNETDSPHTRVGADGRYSITGIPAGSYRIMFSTADQEQHTPDGVDQILYYWGASPTQPGGAPPFALVDGQAKTDMNVVIPDYGTAGGKIVCSNCDVTSLDYATNIAVFYQAYDTATASWGASVYGVVVFSDYSWSARIRNPGIYRFRVADAGTSFSSGFTAALTIAGGQTITQNLTVTAKLAPVPGVTDRGVQSYLYALYNDYLARTPGTTEVQHWASVLATGAPRTAVSDGFVNSTEYRLIRIGAAYTNILGRGTDPVGQKDWLTWMQTGAITTDDIETNFYASQEYFNNHGGTNVSFVTSLYQTLLKRTGGAAEYQFWADLAKVNGRGWVVQQFWISTETIQSRVSSMYQFYLGRTPDPSGLRSWVNLALQIGDSGLRSGFTGSTEYYTRAADRYAVR